MTLEETPFGTMRVYATGDEFGANACVTIIAGGRSVATISADRITVDRMDGWWLNRALVTDRTNRGKGIGAFMLARLKKAIEEVSATCVLYVSPGGYESDTDRQFRFYLANGFEPVAGTPDLLEHRFGPQASGSGR